MKDEKVKIIQISIGTEKIYGLGDDQLVYYWDIFNLSWYVYRI